MNASAFFEERQPGTGDIFWDSLLADLDRLMVCRGWEMVSLPKVPWRR